MSLEAAEERPAATRDTLRRVCLLGAAGLLAIVVLVPPLSGLARRYEFVEALQFSVLAMELPALVVLGARSAPRRPARRRPGSAFYLGLFMGAVIAWRTPVAVDALQRLPWLVAAEVLSLVPVGAGFWLQLVQSPRGLPASNRPVRAAMADVAMWTVWIVAYLVGFSSSSWYKAFHHVAGRGLSTAADQQFSTAVLWFMAAVAFMPVVFWNLAAWLRSEDQQAAGYRSLSGGETSQLGANRSASLEL